MDSQFNPLLSIVIPTYNSGKTINVCLTSILEQSFTNFEILVIDGLSSDDTQALVKEKAVVDNRIVWLSEKDNGIYDAMNKGIKRAKGDWIYFIGSDDFLFGKDVLKNGFSFSILNQETEVIYGNVKSGFLGDNYDGAFSYQKILVKNICHQAIFFRKSVFKKVGVFDLKYKAQADWDHNFKWFLNKEIKHQFIDVTIAHYTDGGFSAQHGDPIFQRERVLKYLALTKKQLPLLRKLVIIKTLIGYAKLRKDYRLMWKAVATIPKTVF